MILQDLENQWRSLQRLHRIVSELRLANEFLSAGGKIIYTVDFSELYAYLHFGYDEQRTFGVGLSNQDPEKASRQHRLALAHLFHTLTSKIHLLPPYTLEVWAYVRTERNKAKRIEDLHGHALDRIQSLDEETKALLSSLENKPLSDEDAQRVLNLVKSGDFEQLCVDVGEVINWNERAHALRTLIQNKKLSYSFYDILRDFNLSQQEIKEPLKNEELKVFARFSKVQQEKRRFARIIDARALIFLRNINQALEKLDTKLILVTRDLALKQAAESLSKEAFFRWPAVREYIQSIETVFLDLILRDTSSPHEKLDWINETDVKLLEMKDSIKAIQQKMRARGTHKEIDALGAAGEAVLEQTSKLWDQHINLRLSLAMSVTQRLHDDYLGISFGDMADRKTEVKNEQGENSDDRLWGLLKNLWTFVSTEEYKKIARRDAKSIWSEIDAECSRMVFLKHLGGEGTERIVKVLSDALDSPTRPWITLRTGGHLIMPSLHFISPKYQEQFKGLQTWGREGKQRLSKIQTAFYMIVIGATSGEQEPEDFLFMAFILGILELWQDAITMAEHSRQIGGVIDPAEVSFFLAFSKRRLGMIATNNKEALKWYVEAYQEILDARTVYEEDPRYIKEQAAIIILCSETSYRTESMGARIRQEKGEEIFNLTDGIEKAKSLLRQALDLVKDDSSRKAEILNNLAYAESLTVPFSWERAENYLNQIDQIIDAREPSDHILQGFGPHFEDTKIMIRAKRAWQENNSEELERCIAAMREVLKRKELTSSERNIFEVHERNLENMLRGLLEQSK